MRDRLIDIIKQCACCYSPPCDGDCGLCGCVEMYDKQIEYIADTILASGIIPLEQDNDKSDDTMHRYKYEVIGGDGEIILFGNPTEEDIELAILNDLYAVDYEEI